MSRTFQYLLLLFVAGIVSRADAAFSNVTVDGAHSCGGIDVPYPFGVIGPDGKGDFRKGFVVRCVDGKPMLTFLLDLWSRMLDKHSRPFEIVEHLPIGNFSIQKAEARVWLPVAWNCYNSTGDSILSSHDVLKLSNNSVFRYSNTKNYLFVLGCNTVGYLRGKLVQQPGHPNFKVYSQFTGCVSYCNDDQSAMDGVCSGVGCCHSDIPPDVLVNSVQFRGVFNSTNDLNFSPCDYGFLAEKDSYHFHTADLDMDLKQAPRLMPVTLDWAIRDYRTCEEAMKNKTTYACISSNSVCLNSANGPGYICNCTDGYEGNPYKLDGCTDIDECDPKNNYPCMGVCENKQGSYDCTNPSFPLKAKISTGALVILLIVAIMVFVFLLVRQKRKTWDYFIKNGGPTLKDLSTIKLYKKDDIRKVMKSCNIIGEGGFGKVYKGCIGNDTQLVAVKEPINVKSEHNDQFANEIIIQSRVIHKNIVKLLGCCLEVQFPVLVYEFVPRGSLDVILHGDKIPLSMGRRLQIAAESAEGLAYMHSKANVTILHGDVKPANILINDDYIPKISDFGISRLIAKDKEHTALVIGDRSYMDPVFFQTGLLTNKSDVYSFGVVLLELITRKKASHSNGQNELLRGFNEAYKNEKSVIELVDKELIEMDPQLLHSLIEMIHECLSLDVNERPDMTDLEQRLRDMVKRFPSTE